MPNASAATSDFAGLGLDPGRFPGWEGRALRFADAAAVATIMAASELHDTGEVAIEEADIVGDWQRPSFDVEASTVGVFTPTGELAAYAEYPGGDRYDATVHPAFRERRRMPTSPPRLTSGFADWNMRILCRDTADGEDILGAAVFSVVDTNQGALYVDRLAVRADARGKATPVPGSPTCSPSDWRPASPAASCRLTLAPERSGSTSDSAWRSRARGCIWRHPCSRGPGTERMNS